MAKNNMVTKKWRFLVSKLGKTLQDLNLKNRKRASKKS